MKHLSDAAGRACVAGIVDLAGEARALRQVAGRVAGGLLRRGRRCGAQQRCGRQQSGGRRERHVGTMGIKVPCVARRLWWERLPLPGSSIKQSVHEVPYCSAKPAGVLACRQLTAPGMGVRGYR